MIPHFPNCEIDYSGTSSVHFKQGKMGQPSISVGKIADCQPIIERCYPIKFNFSSSWPPRPTNSSKAKSVGRCHHFTRRVRNMQTQRRLVHSRTDCLQTARIGDDCYAAPCTAAVPMIYRRVASLLDEPRQDRRGDSHAKCIGFVVPRLEL